MSDDDVSLRVAASARFVRDVDDLTSDTYRVVVCYEAHVLKCAKRIGRVAPRTGTPSLNRILRGKRETFIVCGPIGLEHRVCFGNGARVFKSKLRDAPRGAAASIANSFTS